MKKLPDDLFVSQAKLVERVLREAVNAALIRHKRAGNPIASWKNNRVVIIPPEEIPVILPGAKRKRIEELKSQMGKIQLEIDRDHSRRRPQKQWKRHR